MPMVKGIKTFFVSQDNFERGIYFQEMDSLKTVEIQFIDCPIQEFLKKMINVSIDISKTCEDFYLYTIVLEDDNTKVAIVGSEKELDLFFRD
jgi:hypothetical protein